MNEAQIPQTRRTNIGPRAQCESILKMVLAARANQYIYLHIPRSTVIPVIKCQKSYFIYLASM